MNKSAIAKLIIGAVLVATIATALLFVYKSYKAKNAECTDTVTYGEQVTVPSGEALFILENQVYEYNAKMVGGSYFIKFETVNALFNQQFLVDSAKGVLYYTVPTMNMMLTPDRGVEAVFAVDDKYGSDLAGYVPLITVDGEWYLDMAFVARYSDVTYEVYTAPDRIVVYYQHKENLFYTMKDNAPFHCEADKKSKIYETLPQGTKVSYISGTGNGASDFYYVMTADGRYGYVQNKHLSASFYELWESDFKGPEEYHIYMEGPIRLGWHYTASKKGNDTYKDVVKNTEGMNVYSPRWMYVKDNTGAIENYGELSYVKKAHDAGYKVWVLVQDFDGPDDLDINLVLADAELRYTMAQNMVNASVDLGVDGINLDFEEVNQKSAKNFVQFVKELSILAHRAGLILSVDNLVPLGYNTYELDTQAVYADYIVIMAYDEHYAGSKEAGSVASIGYTRKALANTVALVPRQQIVISVPFYTRLWETSAQGELSSSAVSMYKANQHVEKNKFEKVWDDETCQYVVEYTLADIQYKMWLEDTASLKIKLETIQNGNVAGVAAWRLGFEEDDTWDLITSIIK